jgi:hypothetical protein
VELLNLAGQAYISIIISNISQIKMLTDNTLSIDIIRETYTPTDHLDYM